MREDQQLLVTPYKLTIQLAPLFLGEIAPYRHQPLLVTYPDLQMDLHTPSQQRQPMALEIQANLHRRLPSRLLAFQAHQPG